MSFGPSIKNVRSKIALFDPTRDRRDTGRIPCRLVPGRDGRRKKEVGRDGTGHGIKGRGRRDTRDSMLLPLTFIIRTKKKNYRPCRPSQKQLISCHKNRKIVIKAVDSCVT